MRHYAGQNPVNYTDPDGLFAYGQNGQYSTTSQKQTQSSGSKAPDTSAMPGDISQIKSGLSAFGIRDSYDVTGEFMGEEPSYCVNIVIILSSEKTSVYKATKGTMTVYKQNYLDLKYDTGSPGKEVLTVPIVSGGTVKDKKTGKTTTYAPIAKGTYKNVQIQTAANSGNGLLSQDNHGGKNNLIIRLFGGFLIHQGHNGVSQDGAYTEGCIGITAYSLNKKINTSKNIETDVDRNYAQFKEIIMKGSTVNVEVK